MVRLHRRISQRPSAKRGVHDRGFLKCLLRLRGECRHNFVRLSKKSLISASCISM